MSTLAYITPVDPNNGPVDPGYGHPAGPGHPSNTLPPVPPGQNVPDNTLPSGPVRPSQPIFIPETPSNPIALPPGHIWPPLNPGDGIYGKSLVLVWVVGTDKYRWVSLDRPAVWPPTSPAEPKRA